MARRGWNQLFESCSAADACAEGTAISVPEAIWFRTWNFCIFPDGVMGSVSVKYHNDGVL